MGEPRNPEMASTGVFGTACEDVMDTADAVLAVSLAAEIASKSFVWDRELTDADRIRVVRMLLETVGEGELSREEWTGRMDAIQRNLLRDKRAAAQSQQRKECIMSDMSEMEIPIDVELPESGSETEERAIPIEVPQGDDEVEAVTTRAPSTARADSHLTGGAMDDSESTVARAQILFGQLIQATGASIEAQTIWPCSTRRVVLLLPGADARAQSIYEQLLTRTSNPRIQAFPPPPIPLDEILVVGLPYDELHWVPLAGIERELIRGSITQLEQGQLCIVGFIEGHMVVGGAEGESVCTAPGGDA